MTDKSIVFLKIKTEFRCAKCKGEIKKIIMDFERGTRIKVCANTESGHISTEKIGE